MGSFDQVYFILVHTLIIQYFMRRKLRENKKSQILIRSLTLAHSFKMYNSNFNKSTYKQFYNVWMYIFFSF